MDHSLLASIGLTQGESKVYLALLRLGPTKTGPLAASAGVSSSKVYKILDRLEKKGLAGHAIKQKTKFYRAVEPRRILDYLEEKEEDLALKRQTLSSIIPQLEKEQNLEKAKDEAVVFDGFKAVTNFFRNILDELKPGDSYYVIGGSYGQEAPGLKAFFQNFHTQRADRRIKVNMLANFNVKGFMVPATQSNSDIRFLPEYITTDMQITFYKDKSFIIIWTKNPKGFLIHSEEAVKSFRSYFDALWKTAKP